MMDIFVSGKFIVVESKSELCSAQGCFELRMAGPQPMYEEIWFPLPDVFFQLFIACKCSSFLQFFFKIIKIV